MIHFIIIVFLFFKLISSLRDDLLEAERKVSPPQPQQETAKPAELNKSLIATRQAMLHPIRLWLKEQKHVSSWGFKEEKSDIILMTFLNDPKTYEVKLNIVTGPEGPLVESSEVLNDEELKLNDLQIEPFTEEDFFGIENMNKKSEEKIRYLQKVGMQALKNGGEAIFSLMEYEDLSPSALSELYPKEALSAFERMLVKSEGFISAEYQGNFTYKVCLDTEPTIF